MAQLSIAFCRQLAKARREKGMTQSALAEAVGCKQSAVSMLEAGQSVKVAQETVEKMAALLGVPMESAAPDPRFPSVSVASPVFHAFCPNALCYSNIPYVVNGDLFFWPRPLPEGAAGGGLRCAVCGEVLERRCPHCGAALGAPGACCPACGGARVTNTLPAEADWETWATRRRREIAEWRSLIF